MKEPKESAGLGIRGFLAEQAPDLIFQTDRIDRILATVREHLGMEIAFVSRYVEDEQREFTHISTDLPLPHKPGLREPQDQSLCYHILHGRLPQLIHDAADYPFAQTLPIASALPVGCHLNVPLRLSSGEVYGSFCCLSRSADRTITQRDMGMMKAFAALAIEQIEGELQVDLHRTAIGNAIDEVCDKRLLAIMHQPIVALETGRAVGVECLARFPDASQRSPDHWFADAESVGRGFELEMLAITLALKTLALLPSPAYISINASPATVMKPDFLDAVRPIPRERLVIEVTEHQHIADLPALAGRLRDLSQHARIAIDDVGAGHSGLQQVVELAPDIIKLDMSLTRNVDQDPVRRALGGAMVDFAGHIGSTVLAEGIETHGELAALKALGISLGQGYLLGRPQPIPAVQRLFLDAAEEAPAIPEQRKRAVASKRVA
jgi:EAL domain-containing protein (putative c-di-GMP-specific phosphodiesterase class I)